MSENRYTPDPENRVHAVEEEEIDIKEIILKLWHERKFILVTTGIFLAIGLFIALASPVSYTTSVTFVPQVSESGRGNLGGMAAMMGVNLGSTGSGEVLSPDVYPQIVNSAPFCKDIMETPITVKKSEGTPITLYEYYTNPEYQNKNLLGSIKKYTLGLPGVILSALRSGEEEETSVHNDTITGQIVTLTEDERKVMKAIQENISFNNNSKEGHITMGYTFSEPQATASITNQLFNTLQEYVKEYKTQKQIDNLQFVEESYQAARQDFLQKQGALASFQDANRGLTTALARTTEQRLRSEYDIAFTVYNELAKQQEQAKLAVKESTPLLTVINPVVVPHEKSAPRRSIILVGFIFLGIVVGIGWVFVKPIFTDLKKSIKEETANK